MADKTGRALGTLDPVIFFEKTNGPITIQGVTHERHILMPPVEIGQGPGLARAIWDKRYKNQGYEWREAGTLSAVEDLENRLIAQETKILEHQGEVDQGRRDRVHKETASVLRQRMCSSACTPYEREFIKLWMQLTEEKRKKYTALFTQRNMYIHALEFGSTHKIEDRMGG